MIASGTPCLRVAQKESRKHLVGDKALEKYALRFGVLQPGRRSSQSLSTQRSTRPFVIISVRMSNNISITTNLPYQGQAVNKKSWFRGPHLSDSFVTGPREAEGRQKCFFRGLCSENARRRPLQSLCEDMTHVSRTMHFS